MQAEHPLQVGTAHAYNTEYQEREPPPYPGFSRPLFQPGLRKSYSGSEASTDYSLSSCENLSTSVRQEPQGEENTAASSGTPTEGGTECGRVYQDMLSRLGLSQQQQTGPVEIKSTNTSTFYVTGNNNMSSPTTTTTTCTGSNENQPVNANVNGTYTETQENLLKQMNANNNNNNNSTKCFPSTTTFGNQNLSNVSPKPALPHYQKTTGVYSASPSASPTPSHIKSPSPLKGPSPTPQHGGHYSNPGTPSTPGSLSAPGTPSTSHHKCTPHMGCGSIGKPGSTSPMKLLTPASPTSGLSYASTGIKLSESNTSAAPAVANIGTSSIDRKSPYLHTQAQTLYPSGLSFTDPILSSSDESPTQEVSQSLAQLMTALTRTTTTSGNGNANANARRRRPNTAPASRHLPTVPPPPDYPGYKTTSQNTESTSKNAISALKKDSPAYVWSQPDLSRLAEFQIAPTPAVTPQENNVLPSTEHEQQRQQQPTPSIDHGSHQGYSSDAGVSSCSMEANPIQAMSTSSSTSSLMQYQQQLQLTQGLGNDTHLQGLSPDSHLQGLGNDSHLQGLAPDLQSLMADSHLPLYSGQTSSSSPVSCVDLGLVDPALADLSFASQEQLMALGLGSGSDRQLPTTQSHAAVATRATKMVEQLSEENCLLRQELEGYANKVYRLQKLESELQKVHENYETLEKHTQKQENLEKLIRYKLGTEIKQLRDTNKDLKEHLDKALRQLQQKEAYSLMDSELKNELLGKDSLIAQLITQNRDLTQPKEQLEAEVITQRSAMKEQRNHITMLENLISTMRADMTKLKEELRKRNAEDDKISELQKALSQLQSAVERRESIEQKLRQKLEEEVQYLRRQQGVSKVTEADEGISSDSESPTSLQSLVRQIQEKEQRLLALEAEAAKVMVILVYLWKQKYLEELALRQFAVDAASVPKDARIAALEQNSVETERLIAEARTEKLQHMDEVHVTNRKCAELENKLKMMQAQLAEKDAMIKVLQRHTPHSQSSSLGSLLGSPIHSPRPSYSSPHSSAHTSPLSSHDVSGVSSRQNSQLDTGFNSEGGTSSKDNDQEGKMPIHTKSNSEGTSTTVSSNNGSPINDSQLRELQRRLNTQAAIFGTLPSDSDNLKKYMWQV